MAVVVLLGICWPGFRDRIDEYNKEKLNSVCDEYLLRIFEDHVVVWD